MRIRIFHISSKIFSNFIEVIENKNFTYGSYSCGHKMNGGPICSISFQFRNIAITAESVFNVVSVVLKNLENKKITVIDFKK